MTPRELLGKYRDDGRFVTGAFYASDPLPVQRGACVGVVLLHPGGPRRAEDTPSFLYNVLMDPALLEVPLGKRLRPVVCRLLASLLAKPINREYEMIGGRSPINRLTREQAQALEAALNHKFGQAAGIEFRTYIAARYGHPSAEAAALQMEADGVDCVVLLPLYPQYSKLTTGSSLFQWWVLEQSGEIPRWPTTFVYEYAAHPKYVQAISERIDEALQRFPRAVRKDVHLVFVARGTPLREMTERRDPYCCLVHATVDRVMACRGHDLPFHVTFQSVLGVAEWLSPETEEKLEALARDGARAVLMVPVSFVSDRLETVYRLDVKLRERAEALGVFHYEVTSGLNCHPLFIEALAEIAVAQLVCGDTAFAGFSGDGVPSYALCPLGRRASFAPSERMTRCARCPALAEAMRWEHDTGLPAPVDRPRH